MALTAGASCLKAGLISDEDEEEKNWFTCAQQAQEGAIATRGLCAPLLFSRPSPCQEYLRDSVFFLSTENLLKNFISGKNIFEVG